MTLSPDRQWDPDRLDDQAHLVEADPGGMLPAVASSAAQVRVARRAWTAAGIGESLAAEGRPRAVVVAGAGVSAVAGDLLAAVCGPGVPVPVLTVRSYRLPGWVGAADLVVAVSFDGRTEETVALAREAVRRGCRLLAIGREDSPLHAVARQAGAPFARVEAGGQARAGLWALAVPLVCAASAIRLTQADEGLFEAVAERLEDTAHRCRPGSESFINPGKNLALELAETIPMIWSSSPSAAVAASRFAAQLNQNAGYPALHGEIPDVCHDQAAALDGPLAVRDIFADESARALRLVMIRDTDEHERVARRREICVRMAHDRGVPVTEIQAEGLHPLERIAGLVGLMDYGSVYLALGYGIDPSPVPAVRELETRLSE
ncbi:SIS domain-containing protein [Spongiactinospora sp. TRM90649]|uniref:SIS domain-containing protein n=1 Tax=Spongiactinospora sp. TRM90649 TaxID=3031114 RepID=UPI0023F6EA7B|nr:SIS domain-containing protein [Spongiactinospora sp. TRM90649]MDF5751155.1 SIS domain-containing protein [Spongiactinospora sp. TRM90649]